MTLPLGVHLAIVGGFALVALGFVAAGALRVVNVALVVQKRIEALEHLPISEEIALAKRRLARTSANVATLDRLLARSTAALAEIAAARDRVAKLGRTVVAVGRAAVSIASGFSQLAGRRAAKRLEA